MNDKIVNQTQCAYKHHNKHFYTVRFIKKVMSGDFWAYNFTSHSTRNRAVFADAYCCGKQTLSLPLEDKCVRHR